MAEKVRKHHNGSDKPTDGLTERRGGMTEYDMGFKASSTPMSQRERYELLVELLLEGGDNCISKDFETLAEAKRVQGNLSKAAKAFDGKATVKREGTVVYVVRRG